MANTSLAFPESVACICVRRNAALKGVKPDDSVCHRIRTIDQNVMLQLSILPTSPLA